MPFATRAGLAALANLHKTLTSLDISGCQLVSQTGVMSLSKLTGLRVGLGGKGKGWGL